MAAHVFYINPVLKAQTIDLIADYRKKHPESKTPMADAYAATPNVTEDDKVRFMRAARWLGLPVARHRGNYYENGIRIWQ